MTSLITAKDWNATVLGTAEGWPQSLKSALSICLGSSFSIAIYWGADLALLYNDDWGPILGSKHPWALGRPAQEVWPEIWDTIGPLFESVMTTGQATRSKDQLLAMHRHGFVEECYFDYTFSPIQGEGGKVGGIFNAVVETTFRVISERRSAFLRDFGERLGSAASAEDAYAGFAEIAGRNPQDIPFALAYMFDEVSGVLRQVASAGSTLDETVAPFEFDVQGHPVWPVSQLEKHREAIVVEGLTQKLAAPILSRAWPEPCDRALLLPIIGINDVLAGVLILGVSPRLALDSAYQGFMTNVTNTFATANNRARMFERERQRAEELTKLDRAKTAFFSNVSHEFRTPLTLMLGPLTDALENPQLDLLTRERLLLAQRNALRLSKLVNSLLEFSRIEAGRTQASYKGTKLSELTADLASTFRSAIERAGLTYSVSIDPLDQFVFVDRDMWEKVVLNLLSNALKFTLQGSVTIRMIQQQDHVALTVEDTGVGIPEHELPRVFERFHRIEETQGRTHEGSGIGLALVHELVKLHGGSVSVESVLGRGTAFTVRIPFGTSHLPQDRILKDTVARSLSPGQADMFLQEALRWLPQENAGISVEADATMGPMVIGERYRSTLGARVVIVDDNADMRDYLVSLLSPLYSVEAVCDGREALLAARRSRPALIVSDVMMPRLDGFGLLAEIRNDPQLRTVPLVLLSARAGEEARVEGLQSGADDYIVKPFTARELLARLAAMIELDRTRRAGEEQLRLGLASARMFTWTIDLRTRQLRMSDNAAEFLGVAPKDLHRAYAAVHPDDHARHERLVEETIQQHGEFVDEIRMIRPTDQTVRWIEVRARVVCDEDEAPQVLSGISFDITNRKKMEAALRESDRRKDEFLAMLAHELRNPLAPIRNAGELMNRLASEDTRVQTAVEIVNRQVQQLTRMVDDLLDVSRITRGRIDLEQKNVNVVEVVSAALQAVEPLIRDKGHHVSLATDFESLIVVGDSARLQQCVVNLLNNAAKYTDPGGELKIEVRRARADVVISVADNGTGISEQLLPNLFDLFVQGERTLDRSQGGLGIGLSIVKQLVEMHGGSVAVASGGNGRGSAFRITLPLARVREAEDSDAVPPTSRTKKILLVDDNKDAAESLAMVLQIDGHDVKTAFNGDAALATAAGWTADVALLDIGMPGMDGYQLAARLRALPNYQDATLVALTGYGQPEDQKRIQAASFDHHLVKPASMADLNEILQG
jgi:PAS domain S-box-containing protein